MKQIPVGSPCLTVRAKKHNYTYIQNCFASSPQGILGLKSNLQLPRGSLIPTTEKYQIKLEDTWLSGFGMTRALGLACLTVRAKKHNYTYIQNCFASSPQGILVLKSNLQLPRGSLIPTTEKYQNKLEDTWLSGFGMTRALGLGKGEEAAGHSSESKIMYKGFMARRFFPPFC
jgi:hypothetical protein